MVRLLTLMDNLASEHKALVNQHGLSVLVEKDSRRFLFDCGSGPAFLQNAHRLGVDLRSAEAVILSHSHYDHASGYRDLLESGNGPRLLYTGGHFFERKYERSGIKYTDLSAGFDADFLREHHIEHRTVCDKEALAEGLWVIGHFTHPHSFETVPGAFVKETGSGMVPDTFEDEICLAAESGQGVIVQVGCSHPGIINIVETVHERLGMPVYAVFGGTHLVHADQERIGGTVRRLKQLGVQLIGFSHCSGEAAETFVHADTEVKSCHLAVGDCIMF